MKKQINISIGKQYFIATLLLFIFISALYYIQNIIGYETVSLILLLIIFLLPIVNFEKGPTFISAIISALAWDYYFIPPHFTMKIDKTEDVVMLVMFLIVAVTNGVLTAKLKAKDKKMIEEEQNLMTLYQLIKLLSNSKDLDEVLLKVVENIKNIFGLETIIFFPEDESKLKRIPHPASNYKPDEIEWLLAENCYKYKEEISKITTLKNYANTIYFPIEVKGAVYFILGLKINNDTNIPDAEMDLLRLYIKELIPFLEKFSVYSKP
jgi:two-component system, OmpR family, sensor histidine kinase KdpD